MAGSAIYLVGLAVHAVVGRARRPGIRLSRHGWQPARSSPICVPRATTWTRWSPPCPRSGWAAATPAPGWTIAHQIAHLLWTDRVALVAVTDEAASPTC